LHAAAPRDVTPSPASDAARPAVAEWPRDFRLLHRPQFDAVYREGQRRACPLFVIFYRPNGLDRNRFGMSVRKALGGAVVRNRVRRRIREILRQHRQEIAPGWDIVMQPRTPAVKASFPHLTAEVLRLLRSATSLGRQRSP
jgi:ribonuclease P protein component